MNLPAENIRQIEGQTSRLPVQSESAAVLGMIERVARDPSVDIDKMTTLMQWRKDMIAEQKRADFDEAIASAKGKIPPIARNATGHNDKKYADLSAIAKVVDPVLAEHGLSYRYRTQQGERISVTCILSHKSGHYEETTLSGPPDQTGNKNAIQAIGSTLTYLQRYSLMQALGLAAANDDDGHAASGKPAITQEQADQLRELIEVHGKDTKKFLTWVNKAAKAARIEDIPAEFFQSCVDAIKTPSGSK